VNLLELIIDHVVTIIIHVGAVAADQHAL